MAALRSVLIGCLLLAVASSAAAEKTRIDKAKLVGTWTFVRPDDEKGPLADEAKLLINRDGKIEMTMTFGEKSYEVKGTWKVDGDQLTITMKNSRGQKQETVTITELTDKKLIIAQKNGGKTIRKEFKK
jgi:uncharacterized protein (TIGR03066 family)